MFASRVLIPSLAGLAAALAASLTLGLKAAHADEPASPYRTPAPALTALVDRAPTPQLRISPDDRTLLLLDYPSLPPVAELAQPELRLAGIRLRPATNGPSRSRYLTKLRVRDIATGSEQTVTGLPDDARISAPDWSPDGQRFAFTVTADDGIALFYAETSDARARQLTPYRLNAAIGSPCDWRASSRSLFCKFIPRQRGPAPVAPTAPSGPVIQESIAATAPTRTYQDLLQNQHDERLFEHYLSAELGLVSLAGDVLWLGIEGLISRVAPSPSGDLLLVDTLRRPYSYLVPWGRFPRRIEVYSAAGERIRQVADLDLADDVPIAFGSVRTGRRVVSWRADAPATLYWVEAADGGDIRVEADIRDRVYLHPAPFTAPPKLLCALGQRYGGVTWGRDDLAIVSDWLWQTRNTRTFLVDPSRAVAADATPPQPRVLFDRSWEDRYTDPGEFATEPTPQGTRVLSISDDGALFLLGRGASPEGDRPFVDTLALKDGSIERLWRSSGDWYERPFRFVGDRPDGLRVLTRRESKTEPPDYFLRQLRPAGAADADANDADTLTRLTDFPHPHPELEGMSKSLIRYRRADGVQLTATLYLPPGYDAARDGPLPTLLWAYPTEFKSKDAAGQVTDSPHRFARVGWWSPLVWLLRGYAVLDDPSMPIVGEGDAEPNDTYVEQLVASARAAIDELVRRGVSDRDRVAIGGHSYGAFMTANLLAHSDLFRTGIARSGAYNRTLTPFGFQAEERSLWQASEVYVRMSPFLHADKLDEPLLLIHGEADNNSGTFPLQSRRMYQAVKGLGGVVRLVMLPHESHGYRARESILHMLWETDRWLDRYLKQAAPRADAKPDASAEKRPRPRRPRRR